MKLTNRELYNYARGKHDDSNNDFWKPAMFVRNYEEARLEYIRLKLPDFERNEAIRRDLAPFVAEPHNFGSTNRIALGALLNPYLAVVTLHGEWGFSCNNRVTKRTLPIPPKPIEKAIVNLLDFTEQPEDTDPWYIEEKQGDLMFLRVLSRNVPDNLTLHYIKQPEPFALISDPNGYTQEDYTQQLEILDIALKKREISAENYNKAQAVASEIAGNGT